MATAKSTTSEVLSLIEAEAEAGQAGHRHHRAAGQQDGGTGRSHGIGQRGQVVLTGGAVFPVAGHDEQGVVDADPHPIIAPMVGAALETSIALASSVIAPRPAATATRVRAIRTSAARTVERHHEHDQRGQQAGLRARGLGLGVMNAASPPTSAATPAVSRRRPRPAAPGRARSRAGRR